MPWGRAIGAAALVGLGVALYFALWFRWPTFLAIAVGATVAVVMLLIASSLGPDPDEADSAWRAAAADLAERERRSAIEPELRDQPVRPSTDTTP